MATLTGVDRGEDSVIQVRISHHDGQLELRLVYRPDVVDAGCVAGIVGHQLNALASIAADPQAQHSRPGPPAAEELERQIEGLAAPRREQTDRRWAMARRCGPVSSS
jgi:hypothetical protein